MNKKISLGAALALMLIITAVTFSVTMIFSRQMFSTTITNISEKQAMYDKLSEIDSYVRQNFYGSIDETNLNDYISASASAPPKTRAALSRSPRFTPTPLRGKRASRPGT